MKIFGGRKGGTTEHASLMKVGLLGEFGMGNIGNDASLEAMLNYLRAAHPEAAVDAMCMGPATVRERFGLPAVALSWSQDRAVAGAPGIAVKVLGRGLDVFRMAAWVRRHDAVVVPGMGIFESSLPVRPWGLPSALFVAGVAGRLFRTKVAYVSVGAGIINQRITRSLFYWAARLAFYRSYRDTESREAMRHWDLDVTGDPVYPDLAFDLPVPESGPGDPRIVCIGVMDYHGSSDDRKRADEILHSYISETKRFVQWLLDDGRDVRLLVGDTNGSDGDVAQEILADLRRAAPDLGPSRLIIQPVITLADVMAAMVPAGSVVAIRFHNVVAALMLGKPTIAISYGPKHDSLMAETGVSAFCQPVKALDHDTLAVKFTELENLAPELRHTLAERKAVCEKLLGEQYARLSMTLFSSGEQPISLGTYDLASKDVASKAI